MEKIFWIDVIEGSEDSEKIKLIETATRSRFAGALGCTRVGVVASGEKRRKGGREMHILDL